LIREREIKTTEREAEKRRRRGLTPAETRAKVIERKAETARKKNARAQESADRLQAAMAVVGGDFIPDDIEDNFDDENNFDDQATITSMTKMALMRMNMKFETRAVTPTFILSFLFHCCAHKLNFSCLT
jgi:hypothetical protein